MAFQFTSNIDARYSTFTSYSIPDLLRKLEPARMDASTRSECLTGTRTDLLHYIRYWVYFFTEQRILWLHGLAGSGKSTFSTTVANFFRAQGRQGAFVFFSRDIEERCQPSNVIRTIAYQLGSFDARIATQISAAIDTIPSIVQSPIQLQFRTLLVEPLSRLPTDEEPIILILDALDECGNNDTREDLLALLAKETIHLPKFIRILITSRSEVDLRSAFMTQSHVLVHELELGSQSNHQDVLLFCRHRMNKVRSNNTSLPLGYDWPGEQAIHALAQRAAGLFVWASTACRFIEGHDPRKRIHILLRAEIKINTESALDALYRTALGSAGRWDDVDFRSDFCSVMGTVLAARNPLSDTAIDTLMHLERPSRHAMLRLGCVLQWSEAEPVRIIHPSFADFLSDFRKCGSAPWFIDAVLHRHRLTTHCINHLATELKRNICNVTLSQMPTNLALPDAISYAASYWIDHVCMETEETEAIADILEPFLFQHLLHWLEVMSILKKSRMTIASLQNLLDWLHIHLSHRSRLCELIADAWRFVQTFADVIEDHPLLIYLGALPFTPVQTILIPTFVDQDIPSVVNGQKKWSRLLQVLDGHTDLIKSVASSADGRLIVSGSCDCTVRVWNAISGVEMLAPLRGHEDEVSAVAVSADGRRIVSGSKDQTLRVWDAASGLEVFEPLKSHQNTISSVCFSGDGLRIVSGSWDGTIRVWDATSGLEVLPPLLRHFNKVESVCCSADGHKIAGAGRFNPPIRVWDAMSGAHIRSLGLSTSVTSVAFSPDGTRIVSNSLGDKSVRVWDVNSRINAVEVLEAGSANSVIFSPDGGLIACGGAGGIHLWDALSHQKVSPPLCAALFDVINSVAFSPDGKRVLAGSFDSNIRVWDVSFEKDSAHSACEGVHICSSGVKFSPDSARMLYLWSVKAIRLCDAQSGSDVIAPLIPHKSPFCVALFSPDGHRILSGSYDGSIRVWDALSGLKILVTRGHNGTILHMKYSPDGTRFATTACDDTFRVWNAWSFVEVFKVESYGNDVQSMAFSHDGIRIATVAQGIIIVWDVSTGVKFAVIERSAKIGFDVSLTFSPNGLCILYAYLWPSRDSARHVETWDIVSTIKVASTRLRLHPRCGIHDSVLLTFDGWIVDSTVNKVLGRLPPTISVESWQVSPSGQSVAFITTNMEEPCIMHFPITTLTGAETWDPSSIVLGDEGMGREL